MLIRVFSFLSNFSNKLWPVIHFIVIANVMITVIVITIIAYSNRKGTDDTSIMRRVYVHAYFKTA